MTLSKISTTFNDLVSRLPRRPVSIFVLINALCSAISSSHADHPDDVSAEFSDANIPTLAVLAHESVETETLSLNEIRAIFSLRARQWPNGKPITVLVYHDDSSTHKEFSKNKLKMLPHQLRRQWNRYIYSGTGIGPVTVKSKQEMIDKLRHTPGSIGYTYTGVSHANVRTVSVD